MSPRKRWQTDPLEHAIEAALSPGSFISYKAAWSFVDDVQAVANDIEKTTKKQPERVARLFYRTEPLARKLERSLPDIAARVYRALFVHVQPHIGRVALNSPGIADRRQRRCRLYPMLLWVKLFHDLPPSMWLCVDGIHRPQHNPRALRTGRTEHDV